jgi:hypothetical protein
MYFVRWPRIIVGQWWRVRAARHRQKVRKDVSRSSLYIHSITAGAATVAIILLPFTDARLLLSRTHSLEEMEIGIEHTQPFTLRLDLSISGQVGILELSHDAGEDVAISLPESWDLREVRGGALAEVPADPPALGFTRWHLPSAVTISFRLPEVPSVLLAHNPSEIPLQIRLTRVDLEDGSVSRNVVLMKNTPARVW